MFDLKDAFQDFQIHFVLFGCRRTGSWLAWQPKEVKNSAEVREYWWQDKSNLESEIESGVGMRVDSHLYLTHE